MLGYKKCGQVKGIHNTGKLKLLVKETKGTSNKLRSLEFIRTVMQEYHWTQTSASTYLLSKLSV